MRKSVLSSLAVLLVAVPLSATRQQQPKPQTLSGEAIVKSIGEDRIAVLVDTNDDKTIDQGFLLSSDLPVSDTTAHSAAASVEFTDGYVRLTCDKKVYDLYVAGYPEPPALAATPMFKFIGYALQHSSGESGCNMERAMNDAGACFGYGK